jgi:hypothetical protein
MRRRSRDALREVEERDLLALAKIAGPEKLGEAYHAGPLPGGLANHIGGVTEVLVGIVAHRHLYQTDREPAGMRRRSHGKIYPTSF